MIKYIFCIFVGIFLTLGLNLVPDKDLQKFRTETEAIEEQSSNESNYHTSETVVKQSYKGNNSVRDGMCNCKISDAVPGFFSLSLNLPPAKILKFNTASIVIQKLSSLKSQLSEVRWTGLSSYKNLSKYSNRYYIYTLERILI